VVSWLGVVVLNLILCLHFLERSYLRSFLLEVCNSAVLKVGGVVSWLLNKNCTVYYPRLVGLDA
jgi:hypothetical protein